MQRNFLELKKLAAPLSPQDRWVCLLHDEISIKADLVYDKLTGELVGFIDQSNWTQSSAKEFHLATHALVFMVVGITSNIKMSIGYFPTRTATADEIFPLLWKAVGLLECVCELKVSFYFVVSDAKVIKHIDKICFPQQMIGFIFMICWKILL